MGHKGRLRESLVALRSSEWKLDSSFFPKLFKTDLLTFSSPRPKRSTSLLSLSTIEASQMTPLDLMESVSSESPWPNL